MAEDTMNLVLIRHGETEWNKLNVFTGWTDVELSETGEKEAAAGGRALKEAGFWCVAATEHAEQPCWDAALDGRVAVVMGSEGSGVSRLVLERCDDACLIPQRGRVESLNVAQAASVLCYEWARRTWGGAES